MPERWERELDELRHIEMREPAIRERIERGPTGDRGPSRKHSLVAGIVAGAVAVAGIAALWQLDRNPDGIGTEPAVAVRRGHVLAGARLLRLGRGRHPSVVRRLG